MPYLSLGLVIVVVAALTAAVAIRLIPYLRSWNVVDVPNARSSHVVTTPRGGGLAPVLVIVAASVMLHFGNASSGPLIPVLALGVVALSVISLADDVRSLSARHRFLVQAVVVGVSVWYLRKLGPGPLAFLPPYFEALIILLGWLWFVNLFNFMDGIDGITGTETLSIACGILVVVAKSAPSSAVDDRALCLLAALLIGGAIGFLWVNWSPARVFMGDVGSVPLGFMVGGALLALAMRGQLAAALILPAYYVFDATVTLGERALKGEKLSVAHRQHAYQRAVRGRYRHSDVCLMLLGLNVGLIAAAVLSTSAPVVAVILAYAAASMFYLFLRSSGR